MSKRVMRSYSDSFKFSLLEEFSGSNESAAAFSKRNNIPTTTFHQWRKRHSKALTPFVEVSVTEPAYSPTAGIHSGSLTLSSPETLSLESLTTILTAMQRAVE